MAARCKGGGSESSAEEHCDKSEVFVVSWDHLPFSGSTREASFRNRSSGLTDDFNECSECEVTQRASLCHRNSDGG